MLGLHADSWLQGDRQQLCRKKGLNCAYFTPNGLGPEAQSFHSLEAEGLLREQEVAGPIPATYCIKEPCWCVYFCFIVHGQFGNFCACVGPRNKVDNNNSTSSACLLTLNERPFDSSIIVVSHKAAQTCGAKLMRREQKDGRSQQR